MNPEIANQLAETADTVIKTSAAIAAYGGAVHTVTTPIDLSLVTNIVTLTVAVIAGIYHLILIYKVVKEIKSK